MKSSPEPRGATRHATWMPPDLRLIVPTLGAEPAGPSEEELAWQRGYAEGHAAARAEAEAELAGALDVVAAAASALDEGSARIRGQVATTVRALAVAVAKHLVEREVAEDPAIMEHLVTRALAQAPLASPLVVRLHTADLHALQESGALARCAVEHVELRWTPDATVSRGSVVVDGPAAIVDGRVDRVLLDLYEAIGRG